jgi:predicted nucleotidyltransferase
MKEMPLVHRFLAARFPAAAIAVVGGSTARGTRTPSSDIDLLIVGPSEMFDTETTSLATFSSFEGEGFEVFAYTPEAFEWWAEHDLRDFRPVLQDILLEGTVARGQAAVDALRDRWRPIVAEGPQVDAHLIDMRRYVVTDLLDDLADATDPLEQRVLAHALFTQLGELMLLTDGRWLGGGKWLVRRLREWNAARTDELARPLLDEDHVAFVRAATVELDRLGGRVQVDFVR